MYFQIHPDDKKWGRFTAQRPRAHILQTAAWATLKSRFGWWSERIALADETGDLAAGAQLLFRQIPILPFTFAYLGKGPYGEPKAVAELWPVIHSCVRSQNAIFLKWEPDLVGNFVPPTGFRQSTQTVQPPRTILINIGCDVETILSRMNQGTRRKIRRSNRELTFHEGNRGDLPLFYSILNETAERNGFKIHPQAYYESAVSLFLPEHAALIFAEREGELLAGVMVFAFGNRAWYFYGASRSSARTYNASYGAQWAAILWAREKGCTEYDLWGIPDEDSAILESQFHNRTDGLWGVYGFKRGWGGRIIRSVGAWDYVYNPIAYAAFRAAYSIRRKR